MPFELLTEHPEQPPTWTQTVDEYLAENDIRYATAKPLQGGHSCFVWRIDGYHDPASTSNSEEPCVLKYAEEAGKAVPTLKLDAARMQFEVRALTSGPAASACQAEPSVQIPSVLRTTDRALLMSWAGEIDLRSAYAKKGAQFDVEDVGARLGRWIACLHIAGLHDEQVRGWDGRVLHDINVSEQENLRKAMRAEGFDEKTVASAVNQLSSPVGLKTLTIWDHRPMNTLLRFSGDSNAKPDLTVVDWECAHYGCPVNDIRLWVAEALVLESKYGTGKNMVSHFMTAYAQRAGGKIVTAEFVCKLATSVGSVMLMAVPTDLWECNQAEQDAWMVRAMQYIRAGVSKDMAWLSSSELSPLLQPSMSRL